MRALAGSILISATVIAYQMGEYESLLLEFIAVSLGLLLILADFIPELGKLARWVGRRGAEKQDVHTGGGKDNG
jgi:hypothetical protein